MQKSINNHRAPSWLGALVATAILFSSAANTATYIVNSLMDPTDAGKTTLRDAITNATSPGDIINFSPSISGGTITLSSTLPDITNTGLGLTIDGDGYNITVSGNNAVQVMTVNNSNAVLTLENITIEDGFFSGSGGGGGIFNNGTLTVNNSTFSGNYASGTESGGGGIYNKGELTITNSLFSGNYANGGSSNTGGGISNTVGPLTITNSIFSGNYATGAGIVNDGGGIFNNSNGPLMISNSTFSGNYATGSGSGGGGIRMNSRRHRLHFCLKT